MLIPVGNIPNVNIPHGKKNKLEIAYPFLQKGSAPICTTHFEIYTEEHMAVKTEGLQDPLRL